MTLFEAAASYLRLSEPWSDAVEAMDEALGHDVFSANTGRSNIGGSNTSGSSHIEMSVDDLVGVFAGVFDGHLVGVERTEPLLSAIRPRLLAMPWRQNPSYTDESFLGRYAYCELLGPTGLVPCTTVSIGLLYLAPGTMYPPHAHPAEEAYHLLAGVSEWQAGADALTWRSPGYRMEHPSGVSHAMRSGPTPMLALYVWRGDLVTPARFIPALSAAE